MIHSYTNHISLHYSIMRALVIVESKAKCQKIESILGKGYRCLASLGHIQELAAGLEAIDIKNGFTPTYQLIPSKRGVISDLKAAARNVDVVYLAADPDREGEMIAKHVQEALKLPKSKYRRITFNEITAAAVKGAIENPREIDYRLCEAGEARRVLDRLFGFEWSPLLWQYVAKRLSAGRCQSPALGLMCDRERELQSFSASQFYKLCGQLRTSSKAPLDVQHPDPLKEMTVCLEHLTRLITASFVIDTVKQTAKESNPAPPYTTSTLQQDASTRLGMKPKQTMQTAQHLYEKGYITYMRTDSTALSSHASTAIGEYITDKWGKSYVCTRKYGKSAKNSQEAHEAIRHTKMDTEGDVDALAFDTAYEEKLYRIIWKRAVASQMAAKRYTEQIATIIALHLGVKFLKLVSNETITDFPGFEILDEKAGGSLTPLKKGDTLDLVRMTGDEQDTRPKPRYSEASLVKELEKRGIGRPSTFSTIITTLLDRGYMEACPNTTTYRDRKHMEIVEGVEGVTTEEVKRKNTSQKGRLQATELGFRVRDFLHTHYDAILTEGLTSSLEERLDQVAEGKMDWRTVVREFYEDFHPTVEALWGNVAKEGGPGGPTSAVELGTKGKYQYTRLRTRYGMAFARSLANVERGKASYVSISAELYGDGTDLTLEQAHCLFKFPRKIAYDGGEIVHLCYGKRGFYLKDEMRGRTQSVEGDFSDGTIPTAAEMEAFRVDNSEPGVTHKGPLRKIGPYTVWNGKFGRFIAKGTGRPGKGKRNKTASIPDDCDIQALTEAECENYIKTPPPKASARPKKGI